MASITKVGSVQPAAHDHGCRRLTRWPMWYKTTATFSDDRRHRLTLSQVWGDGPRQMFLLMNPSGADEDFADMTLAKTGAMSLEQGFGGQIIGNSSTYRATDNGRLLNVDDPVHPGNRDALIQMARQADRIVIAHGHLPRPLQKHADQSVEWIRSVGKPLFVLGLSRDGVPVHPLARGKAFVPVNRQPVLWDGPTAIP